MLMDVENYFFTYLFLQKKVHGDQAPSCIFFAKPDICFEMFSSVYFFLL